MRHHGALKRFLSDIISMGSQVFGGFIFIASSMVSLQQFLEHKPMCFTKRKGIWCWDKCISQKFHCRYPNRYWGYISRTRVLEVREKNSIDVTVAS